MNLADYKNIWVFIETECGKPKNVGFELINAAKPLAQEMHGFSCSLFGYPEASPVLPHRM